MAEKEEKKVSESDLIKAFESFWMTDGDRLPVSDWKTLETSDAKMVVSFLKSKREPGPNLRNNSSYEKCKDKWAKSNEKSEENEEFQHDEDRVDWNAVKSPGGISWFVGVRNWPLWMLSETNKHTRGYVLQTVDSHPIKGVGMIIDKAYKRLGEIKQEKEDAAREKQEKKEAKQAKKEQEEQDPDAKKSATFIVYAKNAVGNFADYSRRSNDKYEASRNKRQIDLDVQKMSENKVESAAVVVTGSETNKDVNELE